MRNPSASLLILTGIGLEEKGGIKMALARGFGYRSYLVHDRGVEPRQVLVYANAALTDSTQAYLVLNGADYQTLLQGYVRMADSFVPDAKQLSGCSVSNAKTSTPFSTARERK